MVLCQKPINLKSFKDGAAIDSYCFLESGHKGICDLNIPKQLLQQPLHCTKVEGCIYPNGHKHLCDIKRPYQGTIVSG